MHDFAMMMLGTLIILTVIALTPVLALYGVYKSSRPVWVAEVIVWTLWGVEAFLIAATCLIDPNPIDYLGMLIWATIAVQCWRLAYEIWRSNRRKRRKSVRAAGRVAILGTKLGIVHD